MPSRRVDSGGSSLRALKSAPVASSLAFEVSVLRSAIKHGHRTEAESLYGENVSELSAGEYCGEWLIASESLRADYGKLNAILDGMRV